MTRNQGTDSVNSKPTNTENPKDAIGSGKLPLHLWPNTATAMGCIGLLNGMLKYGRGNWRAAGIRASIYVDACKRHLDAWFEGEECDPDDGVPHLAAALACLAIITDARAAGKLNDDRNMAGGYRDLVSELTPHVQRLKELHADRDPKHYTIADNEPSNDNLPEGFLPWDPHSGAEPPAMETVHKALLRCGSVIPGHDANWWEASGNPEIEIVGYKLHG